MTRSDIATACLVAPLVALIVATFIHVNREKYPVYPMPLHPGTQAILYSASDHKPYRFRFINSQGSIVVETAMADSYCTQDVERIGEVKGEGEIRVTDLALHRDICAVVEPNQFPMVFECWPAPAMSGSYNSCQRWNS